MADQKEGDPTQPPDQKPVLGGGLKFGFTKTAKAPVAAAPKAEQGEELTHLDSERKAKEPEVLVIPLVETSWRKEAANGKGEQGGGGETKEKTEDELAAEAILADLNGKPEEEKDTTAIPLLMRNKVPGYEEARGDGELFKLDVAMRPDSAPPEAYEAVSVEAFGAALLRGMGWKEGEAIGGTNKGLVEPIEYVPRFGKAGLGAMPGHLLDPPKKKKKYVKPGESRDGRKEMMAPVGEDGKVRHYRTLNETLVERKVLAMCVGVGVRVVRGAHEGMYGRVTAVDGDDYCTVKLAISGQEFSVPQRRVELVEEHEYQKKRRHINTPLEERDKKRQRTDDGQQESGHSEERRDREGDRDRHRERGDDRDKGRERERDGDRDRDRDRDGERDGDRGRDRERDRDRNGDRQKPKDTGPSKRREEETSGSSRKELSWLRPGIRVRITSKTYEGGRHYNRKVLLVDVSSPTTCVCRSDEGRLLDGLGIDMVETVIPRQPGASVLIVRGTNAGQAGRILERDGKAAIATVQTHGEQQVLRLSYDDISELVDSSHLD